MIIINILIKIAIFCANRNMELCRSHQYYFDNIDNFDNFDNFDYI